MAMSSDKVVCPYDSVHVVEKHKLIWHLSRCSKTYKGGHTTQMHCPLDYSHVVEAGQLENHVRNCPQLALAAPLFNVATDSSAITGNLSLPVPLPIMKDLVTAEWDTRAPAADDPAAFSDGIYATSDLTSEVSATTTAAASSVWAHGGCGRGRGRATAPRVGGGPGSAVVPGRPGGGGGVGGDAIEDSEEPKPGDRVPGGYRIREDIYYPPDYGGLRGRFEERGSV